MEKNRSTWASLLSLVLAMVVMAGLAVTAFAVTDGGAGNESAPVVDSVDELTAVLNGTQLPTDGVNYDVDGNGIVEWDDLTVLKGEALPDLLPNGGNDWLSAIDEGMEDYAAFQTAIVRGDSTKAIYLTPATEAFSGLQGYAMLSYSAAPIDFTEMSSLTFDTLWVNGAGTLTVGLWDVNYAYDPYYVTVEVTEAGWSTVNIGLENVPAEILVNVGLVDFSWDGEHEVYIDNLQLAEANVTYEAGANGVTKLFDKYVIAGQPYGNLPTPVRPFHIFAGWYADAEYENAVTADTIVAAGDSHTLYAKWEKDESIDTPMSEGGQYAILSVVDGKEDTYLYSVETPSNYESRYLNIDIRNVTAPIMSFDFKFISVTNANGEEVAPAMYISDRQDNGVFGAYYVIVDKATGKPVSSVVTGTEYTVYVTLKASYHTSLKLIPMGNVNNDYKYSVEVSAPVAHNDAPSQSVYMIPSSGNHAMMSWYKTAEGDWQYAYAADNDLPLLAYPADSDYAKNTSYLRRIALHLGAASTEARFDFQYVTAKNGSEDLLDFGTTNGATVTVLDANGNEVAVADRVPGTWYTAVFNMDGASLGTSFGVYTLGNNIDGSDSNPVQVELMIKNLRSEKPIKADDGSVTITGSLYNSDVLDSAITILHEDVQPFAVSISKAGAKQMRFKFKLADATGFAISYVDSDSIDYNNPNIVIVDEDSNAVKAANVEAGKWYTAIVYSEIERHTIDTGTYWSSGEMCTTGTLTITTAGDLQIKEAEALSGLFGFRLSGIAIDMTRLDLSSYGYKYGYSINVNEASKYDTRIDILSQRGLYDQLTFDFCITDFNGDTTVGGNADLWFEGLTTTIYNQDGTPLDNHEDMVIGTWYTVKCDVAEATAGEYAVSLYSFGEDNATRLPYKAYLANINWTAADVMFDHDYAVKTATLERSSNDGLFQVDRVTKYDGRATYEVTASSAAWSDRALKLSLLDSDKDFIQLDFCYTVSRNADGKHVAPSMNVYTNLSGTPKAAQYVIVDANDNPVTELVTGNWYRMFITANGNTQFAIVPETEGWVRVQFNELETFTADEMNVAVTSDDPMNVSSSLLLDRFGDMRYGYANYAGNTGVLTFTPNASTYKQIRFNFLLKEVGTPAMSVNSGSISITDASGEAVNVADLAADIWYTAVITNSGNAIPTSVKLTVGSGNTRMAIKDLKAYDTTEAPAAGTVHSIFHGLENGEMMIAGFLGPREEYYNVHGVAKAPMIRDEIFKLLAESGINYIDDNSFSYSGTQLEVAQDVLRLASKYNLNYFIGATDIANIGAIASSSVNASGNTVYTYSNYVAPYTTFAAKLDELTQYKSFGGLHLRDEPSADLFLKIGEALKHIEDYNAANGTKLEGFVNLLPGVGSHRWTNGQTIKDANGNTVTISTWSDYVRAYADMADPNFLSFDMYPIQGEAGQIEYAYFNFLGYFATVAKEKGLPMAVCIQVGGGEPSLPNKRQANTDEMHWNVNTSLAFGAEAMTYFIMVEPPYYGDNVNADTIDSHTAINVNGEPTPYYDAIKAINSNVKAIDHVIVNGTHKGVIFNGTMPNTVEPGTTTEITAPYDGTQLTKSEAKLTGITGNALIGVYDYEGKTALYVVNNSITSANTIGLTFTGNYTYEIISEGKTSWATGSSLSLNLAIGRGAMVIVHTSSVSTDVTVAFELNYETTTPNPAGKLLTTGDAYGELPTPVRPFYTFGGWYMNPECTGDEVTSTTTMTAMGDHALYAKWDEADLAITQNNANHSTLTVGDEQGTFLYTSNVAGATSPDSRSLQLKVNVTGKEIVKFNFKFTTSLDGEGNATAPDMHVADVNNGYWRGANWVATDENGEPVANFETGKWYTMWITTEGQSSFRIYPMGQNAGQQVNAEMLIKDLVAVDAELPTNYVGSDPNDGATFNHIGFYQANSGDWEIFYSAYNRYSEWLYEGVGANSAYNRRISLRLDAADYTTATFAFKYNVARHKAAATEEAPNPEWTDIFGLVGQTSIVDMNGNTVTTMEEDTWYVAIFSGANGAALAQSITLYPGGYADGNNGAYAEIEMQIKDVQGYKPVTMPVYNNADSSVSVESAGIIDVLTQDGNNIRYQLTADKIPYLSGNNAVRVKLLDTTKQVISMKFTVNTLTDANGAASTPWTRVVTGSGNEANFAVIDEDGNLVKNIAAGKTYTLFITSPEFATNLYSKPSVPTEFVVYPVGMDTQSVADITFSEIAAHAVSGFSSNEGAITHTTTMVHNNLSYYKVGDKWNFSFSASEALFRGNTTAVSTAFTPTASATMLTLPSGNVQAVSMRVRYVEGMNDGAERYTMAASCTVTFYDDNGNVVALADRKAGQWYNVSLTNITGNTITIYPAGHDLKNAAIMLQVADITVMAEDTNPVTIASTETSWVTLTYELVNGKPAYTFNSTAYAAANSSSAWQRCLTLTNPLDEAAVLTMDFKFLSNTDGDGNSVAANMVAYSSASAALNSAIMDKETGKLVGKCEMGKEYTLFIKVDAKATARVHTDVGHAGTTSFQMVITDRAALKAPANGDSYVAANSALYGPVTPYYADGEWRYAYTYFGGTMHAAHSSEVEYRQIFLKQTAGIYNEIRFEFKYDVGESIAADGTRTERIAPTTSNAKYYDMNGNQVTTFTLGTWYKAVITSASTFGASQTMHMMAYDRVPTGGELNAAVSFRNIVALEPDTSPVTVFEADVKNQVALTHDVVDGKHVYTYTTIGTVAPSNAGWSRRQGLRVPEGTTHFAVNFRYTKAYGENGTTEIVPTMSVYKSNLTSNAVTYIYETATGKMVSSGNADNAALTVGTWYTAVVTTEGETSLYMYPCNNSSEKVQVTFEIADRSTYVAGNEVAVFNTPWGDFPEPVYAYINGEWIQKINGSANQVTQEHKQIAVTMRQDGILRVTFEMMMDNATGSAKAHIWNSIGNLKIYNANGDAVSGGALESGVWYTYVYETGANLGTSEIRFGYLGSSTGGLDASIRNVQVTELGNFNVSFNLNYEGATNTPAAITVQQGAAYGTLPTPAAREYYTFAGWYTNAACTGTAVTEDTTVSASHTLYAKWELAPDTNSVKVGTVTDGSISRDIVEGENVYTYTTAGMTTHGGNPKRKVNISFPEGQDYIYVEFRFTESKTAAGADLAPYLRVYDPSNSGNGGSVIETIWIYDANGKQAAKNNSETGLVVGDWYTLVVKVKSGTNFNMCALSHYATDVPLVTMEIRERNCVDDNSNVVIKNNADYNSANATMTHSFVNGKSFFTYTTRGVSSPTTSAGNRRVEVSFPANQQSHVAIEFRYTEAFAADGTTAIAPTLRVYDKLNGGNGGTYISTVEIFDDNGNLVASGNAANSLTVGEWYTLVVGLKTDADVMRLWPCPTYTTDAAILTMEFRDWHAYTDPASDTVGIAKATGTYENLFPKTDGSVVYKTYPVAANTSAYNRRFNITNSADAALVKFDFVFDVCEDANGNPVTPNLYVQYDNPTDKGNYVVTDQEGNPVLDLVVGTKYTMWITTYGNTTHEINVVGNSSAALKAAVTITSRQVVDVTTGAATLYNNAENYGPLSLYKVGEEVRYGFSARTGIQNVPTSGGAYTRRLHLKLDQTTYTKASFEFMYTVADSIAADGTVTTGGKMVFTNAKYYTMDGTEVTDGNFTVGTWYKAEITNDAGLAASTDFYPMGYAERPADGQLNMAMTFRNLQAS